MYAEVFSASGALLTSLVHDLDRFTPSLFIDLSSSYFFQESQTLVIFGVCEMGDLEERHAAEVSIESHCSCESCDLIDQKDVEPVCLIAH